MKTALLFILTTVGIHHGADQMNHGGWFDNPSGWKMVDLESGIRVYERWVTIDNGLSVRERRGEFEMQADAGQLAAFIMDVSKWETWMSQVETARVIGQKTPDKFYVYTRFSVPQPFSQRDLVSMVTLTTSLDAQTWTIDLKSAEGVLPEYKGINRVGCYQAKWTLTKVGTNKVRVGFTALSGEPPAFPRWIQDPIIKRMFMNNLTNLKGAFYV
jgi:hypothetical protein